MISFLFLFFVLIVVVVLLLGIAAAARRQQVQKSIEQIPQMIARIYSLETRIAELERKITVLAAAAAHAAAPAATPASAAVEPFPHGEQSPASPAAPTATHLAPDSAHHFAQAESPREPSHVPPPAPPLTPPVLTYQPVTAPVGASHPAPHAPAPARPRGSSDFESLIAGRWLNVLGILALFLAAAFFLKYAFDNDWVGPAGRVGIGVLVGFAMFPLSDWLEHRGYKYFAEGIAGLGVAILYLAVWTGWHTYGLFQQSAAFGFMVLITAATVVVAVVRDSQRIAVIGLIAGLLTPILTSTGENQEGALFGYLVVLGLGAVVIAWVRGWKVPPPLQFMGTVIYFWGWYTQFYSTAALSETLLFATIFFALFAAIPAIRALGKGEIDGAEITLVLANSLQYLCVLGELLWPYDRTGLTVALLILAAVHLLAATTLGPATGASRRAARILYGGLALTFATIVIPVRLDGQWITIAFAVEAAALVWGGLRISSLPLRIAGIAIYPVILLRLMLADVDAGPTPFFNARFFMFALAAASMLAAFLIARASRTNLGPGETAVYYALGVCANLVFLIALSMEVWDWFGEMRSTGVDQALAQQLALSILWIGYAIVLMAVGMVRRSAAVRWQSLVLLGFAVAKVFLWDLSFLTRFYRIVSFLILGLVLMLVSFLYQRRAASGDNS